MGKQSVPFITTVCSCKPHQNAALMPRKSSKKTSSRELPPIWKLPGEHQVCCQNRQWFSLLRIAFPLNLMERMAGEQFCIQTSTFCWQIWKITCHFHRIHWHQSRVFAKTFTRYFLCEGKKQTDRRGGVSDLSIFELSFPASRNRMRRVREAPQKNNPEKTLRRGRSLDNRSNNSEWIGKEFHYPDDR